MCIRRLMVIGVVVFLALVLWADSSYAAGILLGTVKKADGSLANTGTVILVNGSGYRWAASIRNGQYALIIGAGVYWCSAESAGQRHPAHQLLKNSAPQRHDIRLQR